MLTLDKMHDYQRKAVNHQLSHEASAMFMGLGLGKTIVTLTSAEFMLRSGYLKAVLIVAPIRVCRLVWRQESARWEHTKDLTFSMVMGTVDQRTRALLRPANVYLINYDNLQWIAEALHTYYVSKGKPLPFDGVVFDELSLCKNSTTNRVKALRKILPSFKWRTGLTGTPASNGYRDLHGEFLVLDDGKRLGTSKTAFMTRFYRKDGFKYTPYPDTESQITHLISDITLELSSDDYIKMPDLIINDIKCELPPEVRKMYNKLEKDYFIQLDSGSDVEVFNAGSLTNKLLQIACGCVYPIAGMPMWEAVHSAKLEALEDIIEECSGEPILLAYTFRSDAERILKHFHKLDPINLTDCKSEHSLNDAMRRWETGDCPLMIGHSASMSHGIDGLQRRGNTLVEYGQNWSLDLTKQFRGRLRRQGQGRPVTCHRILCTDTMEDAQVIALSEKDDTETSLRKAIKEYRERKNNS